MTYQYPPVPAPAPPPRALRIGDPMVVVGALIVFGFSFAPFVRYGEQAERSFVFTLLEVRTWFSAWSLETFMAPLTTFVVLAGLLAIAAVVIRLIRRRDPELLGFRLRQLEVGLSLFMFVVLLGMVASNKHLVFGARQLAEADPSTDAAEVSMVTGWGAVLMLIGAGIAALGAVLNHFSVGPVITLGPASQPAAPPAGAWPGWQQPPASGQWPAQPPASDEWHVQSPHSTEAWQPPAQPLPAQPPQPPAPQPQPSPTLPQHPPQQTQQPGPGEPPATS